MGQWAELLQDWPQDADIGYNIAPTQIIPSFTAERGQALSGRAPSGRAASGRAMRWGIIPSWSREPNSKYATFNARAESVADKPAFRNAWNKSQTCLIPAIGYYEWKGTKGQKQPWFIHVANGEPLVMAGLWEVWQKGDQSLYSCTIITRPSHGKLAAVHTRMPLMLEFDQAEQWLNDGVVVFDELVKPQNIERLAFHPVSKAVNKSTHEGEQLIDPIATMED